jgi:hypothetical protein
MFFTSTSLVCFHKQRHRQTDRQTDRQRDRQRERERERERENELAGAIAHHKTLENTLACAMREDRGGCASLCFGGGE